MYITHSNKAFSPSLTSPCLSLLIAFQQKRPKLFSSRVAKFFANYSTLL
jgi:hypothetical protein